MLWRGRGDAAPPALPASHREGIEPNQFCPSIRFAAPPVTGTAGGAVTPQRGPPAPLLPPARVASQLAASVTAVMSEREDYDFKRKNKQKERITSFSRRQGRPNVRVMLLIKEQRRRWQRSRPPMLQPAPPTAPASGKDHPEPGHPGIPRDARPVSRRDFTLDPGTGSPHRVSGSREHPEAPN